MVTKVKNEALFFLAVIILAIYLRIQGLGRGLPYVLNPEEIDLLSSNLYLLGNFISSPYLHFTDFFAISSSLFTALFTKSINIHSLVKIIEVDPAIVLFPFRILIFLSSVISVICVYFIARGFGGFAAIGSAGIFAISLLSIAYSTTVAPIVLTQLFILLSLIFLLKAYQKASPKLSYIISLILGIVASSLHAIGLLAIFPILVAGRALKKNIPSLSNFRNMLIFLFLFVLLNPIFLFHLPHHIQYLLSDLSGHQKPISYILFLLKTYVISFGFISILLLVFLPWALRGNKKKSEAGLIFAFPVLYLIVLNMFHLSKLSYQVLMIPYIAIGIGIVFNAICMHFTSLLKWQKILAILFVFLLFWMPLKAALTYNKLIRLPDTRIVATQWIKKKTNEHYTVAWDRNSIQLNHLDVLDKGILGKAKTPTKKRESIRRRFIIGSKLLKQKNWFKVLKKKADYVVIDRIDMEKSLRSRKNTLKKKYYKQLLKEKPVAVFNPYYQGLEAKTRQMWLEDLYMPFATLFKRERFGPLIMIYEL